jgi:hypothetical protein
MKKFLILMVVLCFAFCAFAKEVAPIVKKADVTKEVAVVLTQADWVKANVTAKQLGDEEKYLEASDAYLTAGKIAVQVKDGYDKARLAWALNNASYMIILQHKKDNKVDLSKARAYLEEALTIGNLDADCERCIKSNASYIDTVSPKPVEVKKEEPKKK